MKAAIDKGVRYLRTKPNAVGSFGPIGNQGSKNYNGGDGGYDYPAGPTALALYALLKCGVPATDPVIVKGFASILKAGKIPGTAYERAALLLALVATADPAKSTKDSLAGAEKVKLAGDRRKWAVEVHASLLAARGPSGWRYYGPPRDQQIRGGPEDISSTQLAVIALLAADRCGIGTDGKVLADVIRYAMSLQNADGPEVERAVHAPMAKGRPTAPSGGYAPPATGAGDSPRDRARGFMYLKSAAANEDEQLETGVRAACGVGTVVIARFLLQNGCGKGREAAWAKLKAEEVQASVYDGLAWLAKHWEPFVNPGTSWESVYYLYCVERLMDLVGSERLGGHTWYLEMAEKLLPRQEDSGAWKVGNWGSAIATIDTSFAILFLHRAMRGNIRYPSVTGGSDVPATDNR